MLTTSCDFSTYLGSQIEQHIARFFTSLAMEVFNKTRIVFCSYHEVQHCEDPAILIPVDIPSQGYRDIYKVPFNNTVLNLWNRLPKPQLGDWYCFPDSVNPLWYANRFGTLMPAWNFFGNLWSLLTLQEEKEISQLNRHDRVLGKLSPRLACNLLEVPAFNEAIAVLVAMCRSLERDRDTTTDLHGLVRNPTVVLSHDVDALRGNDLWTQGARMVRFVKPLGRLLAPKWANLYWIFFNFLHPYRYYLGANDMAIELEKEYGSSSSFYFLYGKKGRYGSRDNQTLLEKGIKRIPKPWVIGIHYNYYTFLNERSFRRQLQGIGNAVPALVINSGRGHYLRFDRTKSFRFLAQMGIDCDETLGYPDVVGYRAGIGGAFQPYDEVKKAPHPIWEVPLVVMDVALHEQYGTNPLLVYKKLLSHIGCIGGALSILVHPDLAFSPESRMEKDFFPEVLSISRSLGARICSAEEMLKS